MNTRKLTEAELARYGSQANFEKLQNEYLDGLEAAGGDPRGLQDRLKKLGSDKPVVPKSINKVLDGLLAGHAKDVRAIALSWYENPYFKYDAIWSYPDLVMWVASEWLAGLEKYDPNKGVKDRTFCSVHVNNAMRKQLRYMSKRRPAIVNSRSYEVLIEKVVAGEESKSLKGDNSKAITGLEELLDSRLGDGAKVFKMMYGIGTEKRKAAAIAEELSLPEWRVLDSIKKARKNKDFMTELNRLLKGV
tara:strand:+ start:7226 stop:7966 length:741 start_codon:yes stop_codon:yes gene_type:complete